MAPLCGMTRALRATMLGHVGRAWAYNPASIVLAVGAVAALVRAAVGCLTGQWLNLELRR